MKDLKEFMNDLSINKSLAKKINNAKSTKDVTEIAADHGYSFDENDLKKVSGGLVTGGLVGDITTGDVDLGALNFDFSKLEASINQNVNGAQSTVQNTGGVSLNKGK